MIPHLYAEEHYNFDWILTSEPGYNLHPDLPFPLYVFVIEFDNRYFDAPMNTRQRIPLL